MCVCVFIVTFMSVNVWGGGGGGEMCVHMYGVYTCACVFMYRSSLIRLRQEPLLNTQYISMCAGLVN